MVPALGSGASQDLKRRGTHVTQAVGLSTLSPRSGRADRARRFVLGPGVRVRVRGRSLEPAAEEP